MSVKSGFLFPRDEQGNAPSSGDGASVESKYDPNTGLAAPGYVAPSPSKRQDAHGGLNTQLSEGRNSERDYRETYAASSGVHGGGAEGLALPTDVERFRTTGQISGDSNRQSASTTGGTDRLVVNDTLPTDSNLTAGGRVCG